MFEIIYKTKQKQNANKHTYCIYILLSTEHLVEWDWVPSVSPKPNYNTENWVNLFIVDLDTKQQQYVNQNQLMISLHELKLSPLDKQKKKEQEGKKKTNGRIWKSHGVHYNFFECIAFWMTIKTKNSWK